MESEATSSETDEQGLSDSRERKPKPLYVFLFASYLVLYPAWLIGSLHNGRVIFLASTRLPASALVITGLMLWLVSALGAWIIYIGVRGVEHV